VVLVFALQFGKYALLPHCSPLSNQQMCQQVAADQVPEGEAAVDAAADDCNDSTSQQILALLQHSLKGQQQMREEQQQQRKEVYQLRGELRQSRGETLELQERVALMTEQMDSFAQVNTLYRQYIHI
jgi:non-homologous end joining protein Ku